MTNNDDRNHVGSCWSSSPITYNSKWSIRTPRVLIKKEVRYSNVCKTKVAPNYILSCVEPTQNSWSSPSITYNSKVSIRIPSALTLKDASYNNFYRIKVAPQMTICNTITQHGSCHHYLSFETVFIFKALL